MTEFIVELYVPRNDCGAVAAAAKRLTEAAAELTAEGRAVQFVRSIFVPSDETCFLLVEGGTADDVRETARRAGVLVDSVAETSPDYSLGGP